MPRILHTADWHLGRSFHRTVEDPRKQVILRQARFQALERMGAAARAAGAEAILVAGDLFDGGEVDDDTVVAGLDAIGRMGLPVVAIPGNHDHGGPGGLWDRAVVAREQPALAPNLVLLRGGARVHAVAGIAVLALPVDAALAAPRLRDLAALAVAEGVPRVGLVHGPVGAFDEDGAGRSLDPAGAGDLRLDYLALGDFHRQQRVERLPAEAWYAGTHEPDRFPTHGQADERHGAALLVDLPGPGQAPVVTPLTIPDSHVWVRVRMELAGVADLERLAAELERLAQGRAQTALCEVDLDGSVLGCAERERLDALLDRLRPRFLVLEARGAVRSQPLEAELGALTGHPGIVGVVAAQLAAEAAAGSEVARAALVHLHLLSREPAPAGAVRAPDAVRSGAVAGGEPCA